MKNQRFELIKNIRMNAIRAIVIAGMIFAVITCGEESSYQNSPARMEKADKTAYYIESDYDESVDVPPPPWGASYNADGEELKGYNINITENTVLGISHIYRKNTGPESQGLLTLFIIEKGDLSLTWADPKYTTDDRLDHINDAVRNNCVIVLAVHEIRMIDARNVASAENFWNAFKMTPTTPHPLAPEQEYFVRSVTGIQGTINIINGTLKVL